MKVLRYFAALMTEVAAMAITGAAMWVWTQRDIVQILACSAAVGFISGLMVLLVTEPEAAEEEEEGIPEKVGVRIYTLYEGQFYGRRIS